MILDDFTMLGKTVPEPNSDGRVFVCSAGYSPELRSLVRIYPLARHGAPKRWDTYQIPLERNPKDSRPESWQVAGDRTLGAHDDINASFQRVGKLAPSARSSALGGSAVESIAEANTRRLSLAIIHPSGTPELTFEHNPDSPDSPELRLFDVASKPATGARRFAFIPRLRFDDLAGSHHLMLRDWGCFEFLRKFGDDRRHELTGALHLGSDSSLLIGNLSHQRNAWLVISVLNGLRPAPTLFDTKEVAA